MYWSEFYQRSRAIISDVETVFVIRIRIFAMMGAGEDTM